MKDEKRVLYIIAGANGSGKSTLAQLFLPQRKLEFLNADEIAKEISPNAIDKVPISAGKVYFKRLAQYFSERKSFAVESTLSGNNIVRIIDKARAQNYKTELVYLFLPNCMDCIERVKKRVQNGGHNVPAEDIIRRYYKSVVKFWCEYRFLVDEWTLFYNGNEYTPVSVSFGQGSVCNVIDFKAQQEFMHNLNQAKEQSNGAS